MKTGLLKIYLSGLLSCVAFIAHSQTYKFAPTWKVGDKKIISYKTTETELENDVLISDTTYFNEGSIEVLSEDNSSFTIKAVFENQALSNAQEFYNKIGEELVDYRNIELIIAVDKETAATELLNWEESQEFILNSFDQIEQVINEQAPEMASLTRLLFFPLKTAFESKETTEAYILQYLKTVFSPYNLELEPSKPFIIEESGENPLNPSLEMSISEVFTLEEVNKKSGECLIRHEVKFDMTELIAMINDLMSSMMEALSEDDENVDKKSLELDEDDMSMTNEEQITFNIKTGWVEHSTATSVIIGTNPEDGIKTEKTIEIVTSIK